MTTIKEVVAAFILVDSQADSASDIKTLLNVVVYQALSSRRDVRHRKAHTM